MWQPLCFLAILLIVAGPLDPDLVDAKPRQTSVEEPDPDADADADADTDTDADGLASGGVEGASRGVTHGWATEPHAWIGTAWDHSKKTDKFAGNVIHLGNNHILSHKETSEAIKKELWNPENQTQLGKPAPVLFRNPNKINVDKGPETLKGDDFLTPHSELRGSPFHLHKIVPVNSGTTITKWDLAGNPKPHLEHNVQEFGSDCHGYAWARNTLPGSGPYSSRDGFGDKEDRTRHFVRFPVDRKECNGILCSFSSALVTGAADIVKNCNTMATHGSPILCGPEKKLTYVIAGSSNDVCKKKKNFEAYHVPQIINGLKGLF